jgi:hypothetical protein
MEETIAKQAKSIDDLKKTLEEQESFRRKNEERLKVEARQKKIERQLAEEIKEKAEYSRQTSHTLFSTA